MLHQGIEHTQQSRDRAGSENQQTPEDWSRSQEVKEDSNHPVDPGFDEHPRHQGRNVTWSNRVGCWQPDMQWDDSCLDPESNKKKEKSSCALRERQVGSSA